MKFCYLCPDLGIPVDGNKGASSHIRGFIKALTSLGHDVVLAVSRPVREGTVDVPVRVIPRPRILDGISDQDSPRVYRALGHLLTNGEIEKLLHTIVEEEKPDLIYERYSPFSAAGGITARHLSVPHILEVNAPLAEQGKQYRKQALQEASELMEKTAFAQAGFIVTLTHQLKEWLQDQGISEKKIFVRPCGVDETLFSPKGEVLKGELQDKFVLGFVGSLKPWHDIDLLSGLMRALADDPKYHLLVVGDGPMAESVRKLQKELPGRVTLTGAVAQETVPAYIRAMDVALAPYPNLDLFYFSPLKVFEYMACGRPLVATGIGQLNELIRHGETGWLVPPGGPERWAEAVKRLEADRSLREALGKQARKEAVEQHTWEKRAASFIDLARKYIASGKIHESVVVKSS